MRSRSRDGSNRPGDWICESPTCGNSNYGWQQECYKCDTVKGRGGQNTMGILILAIGGALCELIMATRVINN